MAEPPNTPELPESDSTGDTLFPDKAQNHGQAGHQNGDLNGATAEIPMPHKKITARTRTPPLPFSSVPTIPTAHQTLARATEKHRPSFHESNFGQQLGGLVNRFIAVLVPEEYRQPQPADIPDMAFRVGNASRIGSKKILEGKTANEDSTYTNPHTGVYAVADGLGGNGHNGGQYASREAITSVESISRFIESKPAEFFETADGRTHLESIILKEVRTANERIYALRKDPAHQERKGMNSTLSLAVTAGGYLFTVNIGDSRIYEAVPADTKKYMRKPDGSVSGELSFALRQLTKDDSFIRFVQGMSDEQAKRFAAKLAAKESAYHGITADDIERIRLGFPSLLDAELSRYSSIMTRALGMGDELNVECRVKPLEGDLLLISDGAAMLSPADLMHALGRVEWERHGSEVQMRYTTAPHAAAQRIVEAANGTDYIHNKYARSAFVELRAREELLSENMHNREAMMRDLGKSIEQMSFDEVKEWVTKNNPAALTVLDDPDLLEYWRREFENIVGRDDVSAVYVRTMPVKPAAITKQVFWRSNNELRAIINGAFANAEPLAVYEYENRLAEAEETIASLKRMYNKLGRDPNALVALDRMLDAARRENEALRSDFVELQRENDYQHGRELERVRRVYERELQRLGEEHQKEISEAVRRFEAEREQREVESNDTLWMILCMLQYSRRRKEEIANLTKANKGTAARLKERREVEQEFLTELTAYLRGERTPEEVADVIALYRGRRRDEYADVFETANAHVARMGERAGVQAAESERLMRLIEEERGCTDAARVGRDVAEGALSDAVAIVHGLDERSGEQADEIKNLKARIISEAGELRGLQQNFVRALSGLSHAEIHDMAGIYRAAGRHGYADIFERTAALVEEKTHLQTSREAERRELDTFLTAVTDYLTKQTEAGIVAGRANEYREAGWNQYADILDAVANFLTSFLDRVDAAQQAEVDKNASEIKCDTLEDAARAERQLLAGQIAELNADKRGLQNQLGQYIETYGAVIGALEGIAKYLAMPREEGALVDFPSEILREMANEYARVSGDTNLYKLLNAMADVTEGAGRMAEMADTVLPSISEQHRLAYKAGMRAFKEGNLPEARTVLETFRQTDVAPGLYLLGTVVSQLYPAEDKGAQDFARYLIHKARMIDEEIKTKMEPVLRTT